MASGSGSLDGGRVTIQPAPTVPVEGINSEGSGVARLPDGRVVFIPRTAPGDRARIRLVTEKKRWARGEVIELEAEGPGRRPAPCPLFDRCGGCALQHLDPDTQRLEKAQWVAETLRRLGGLTELPPLTWSPTGEEFRYRNRLTFHLRRLPEGRVAAGFHHRERPGRVVDMVGECLLPEPALIQGWTRLRASWGPGARHLPGGAALRLTLRATASGELLLLVEGGRGEGDLKPLLSAAGLHAIWVQGDGEPAPRRVAGRDPLPEQWLGEEIGVNPGAFLQVNRAGAEAMRGAVLETLGVSAGESVVDAYCGVGSFGRALAARGVRVTGIELNPQALAIARSQKAEGVTLLEGPVEELIAGALPAEGVILNPPRGGVAEGVMETLVESAPRRIVYVSCSPPTLARDLGRLGEGYQVGEIRLFDLFPQTAHVETLIRLDRID